MQLVSNKSLIYYKIIKINEQKLKIRTCRVSIIIYIYIYMADIYVYMYQDCRGSDCVCVRVHLVDMKKMKTINLDNWHAP